jgi:hypothetical protein
VSIRWLQYDDTVEALHFLNVRFGKDVGLKVNHHRGEWGSGVFVVE